MWGEAPANDNATKFGTGIDVQDVITHAKFYGENLRGSDFTGARILAFSVDFAWALTQCCDTALHVKRKN